MFETEGVDARFETRDLVAACMRDLKDGRVELPKDGAKKIAAAVDDVLDRPVLMEVVDAILVIAHFVETELASKEAAARLLDIVNREEVLAAMKGLTEAKTTRYNESARAASADLAKLTKHRVNIEMTAPKANQKAPKGTVKLDSLSFPKRL